MSTSMIPDKSYFVYVDRDRDFSSSTGRPLFPDGPLIYVHEIGDRLVFKEQGVVSEAGVTKERFWEITKFHIIATCEAF